MRNALRTSTSCSLAILGVAGATFGFAAGAAAEEIDWSSFIENDVTTITLEGVVRDFRAHNVSLGHPDFERVPDSGMGVYCGLVEDTLDADGKPQYKGAGLRLETPYRDAAGNEIAPQLFDPAKGDVAGVLGSPDDARIESERSFRQWYRDVPGTNNSARFAIDLVKDSGTGRYVYDAPLDTQFARLYGGGNKNRNYTYEVETYMAYAKGAGDVLTFTGDDDIWVFIDDQLVIDLGGIHQAKSQSIELDRLDWLVDGQIYTVRIFYANRWKNSSRLRIETTIRLRSGALPSTMGMFD